MRTKEYPTFNAGLVINLDSDAGRCLLNCLAGTNDVEELEEMFDAEWYSVAECLPNTTYYDAGNQTLFFLPLSSKSDGSVDCSQCTQLSGNIFIVFVSDTMKFYGVPYQNVNELITEFKKLVGMYLPDDFDYAEHIGVVTGWYYG